PGTATMKLRYPSQPCITSMSRTRTTTAPTAPMVTRHCKGTWMMLSGHTIATNIWGLGGARGRRPRRTIAASGTRFFVAPTPRPSRKRCTMTARWKGFLNRLSITLSITSSMLAIMWAIGSIRPLRPLRPRRCIKTYRC
ncbi:unnamed protein product, partial [Symbiodinium microadriaticum]